jgi:hypothetical protein
MTTDFMTIVDVQIATLKDQLNQEMRKRQQFISRSTRAGDEIMDIRNKLDTSLTHVSRNPTLDQHLLDYETRKLEDAVDVHSSLVPTKLPRHRSPTRGVSPSRLSQSPSLRTSGISPSRLSRR